jgi:hypothetical protein
MATEETALIYNAASGESHLPLLGLQRRPGPGGGTFVNPRTFEIAACGGFQLTDRVFPWASHFDLDSEIAHVRDIDELKSEGSGSIFTPPKLGRPWRKRPAGGFWPNTPTATGCRTCWTPSSSAPPRLAHNLLIIFRWFFLNLDFGEKYAVTATRIMIVAHDDSQRISLSNLLIRQGLRLTPQPAHEPGRLAKADADL